MKAAKRHALPASDFVYPEKEAYPVDTKARARNALARAAQSKTSGSYDTVAAKVRSKYPDIQTKGSAKAAPAKARTVAKAAPRATPKAAVTKKIPTKSAAPAKGKRK